jgi:hypothetical protein
VPLGGRAKEVIPVITLSFRLMGNLLDSVRSVDTLRRERKKVIYSCDSCHHSSILLSARQEVVRFRNICGHVAFYRRQQAPIMIQNSSSDSARPPSGEGVTRSSEDEATCKLDGR